MHYEVQVSKLSDGIWNTIYVSEDDSDRSKGNAVSVYLDPRRRGGQGGAGLGWAKRLLFVGPEDVDTLAESYIKIF